MTTSTTITLDRGFAQQKLRSAIRLADSLLAGDWPYDDSKKALERIRNWFQDIFDQLSSLHEGADKRIIESHCKDARSRISQYMPFIGFIWRSSNVRNAFEIYEPLRN
jgi:hypothetical protein